MREDYEEAFACCRIILGSDHHVRSHRFEFACRNGESRRVILKVAHVARIIERNVVEAAAGFFCNHRSVYQIAIFNRCIRVEDCRTGFACNVKVDICGIRHKFGAQIGIIEGATGFCYALPTKGFSKLDLKKAVQRFKDYVDSHSQFTYLITPVGCGHAGFSVSEVSALFADFITYPNVMLPKVFIEEYKREPTEATVNLGYASQDDKNPTVKLIKFLKANGKIFNESGTFALKDEKGDVIAEAELGIESEKIVFYPFNIQSANTFKNHGYSISTPEDYINSRKEK